MMNGMALYKGFIPFGGTFLTFSDYARNAIRLAAIMRQRVVFVYTHDSIGLGEDGPTHQPVEQLSSLRLMPHVSVWRPCDTVETAVAWRAAIEREGPTCLLFSRQTLPFQERDAAQLSLIQRGGYILLGDAEGDPDAILIATGSEIALAIEAAKQLKLENIFVRVVSMPATDVFLQQEESYRNTVLPETITTRVAIEAGISDYWYRFVGMNGRIIGLDRYGASAPAKDVYRECGLTSEHIVAIVKEVIYSAARKAHHLQAPCISEIGV
jgi:transketolase